MAAGIRTLYRSFNGGELSVDLYSRVDDARYSSGLAKCRNFIPKPQGPVENRPGTLFVRSTRDSSKRTRLIPFTYSTTQSIVVAISEGGIRFHTDGATLLAPSGAAWDNTSATATISVSPNSLISFSGSSPCQVTWNAHGLSNGAKIAFTTSGTLPTGISLGVTYYVSNAAANTFNVSAEPGGPALETSGISIGNHFCHALVSAAITLPGATFVNGDSVAFSTTGGLPLGITAGVVYYVVGASGSTFKVDVDPEGEGVETYGLQSGTHTVRRGYQLGDIVIHAGSRYYAIADSSNVAPPDSTKWYPVPVTGELEIPSPYLDADLFQLAYAQSSDVLTIVHVNYPPMELRRLGASAWELKQIAFRTSQVPPTNVVAVASGGTGTNYKYVVTSVDSRGFDESGVSNQAQCNGNIFASGAFNTINWKAVPGITRYRVYKLSGGLFGYIGQADNTTTFKDDNIAADMSRTPPIPRDLFNAPGDYPGAVSYFEQRRIFAGTTNEPQNIWMSRTGTESNMDYSLPARDDDSVQFRIAARELNTIRHLVPLSTLLIMTHAAEWRLTSVNSDAITPSSVSVSPQSYIGASYAQPVTVGNNVLFGAARGGHLRELAYSWQHNGYISGDLSLRSTHLFDRLTIVDMAYAKAPSPVVWAVSSNGVLLSFTYVPEQQVGAWAWHDTDGLFESCCVVPEGEEDALYVVVKRLINGSEKRYIERMHSRAFSSLPEAFFVDCGLSYSGQASTTISGLSHLEGKTVAILGDGAVMPEQRVVGGAITLPDAVSYAHIGLPIEADIETLPLAFEEPAFGQGRMKNVSRVHLRTFRSSGVFVGPSFDRLTEFRQRTVEPYGSPPALQTDELSIDMIGVWSNAGKICIRQRNPLPLSISGMAVEVTVS